MATMRNGLETWLKQDCVNNSIKILNNIKELSHFAPLDSNGNIDFNQYGSQLDILEKKLLESVVECQCGKAANPNATVRDVKDERHRAYIEGGGYEHKDFTANQIEDAYNSGILEWFSEHPDDTYSIGTLASGVFGWPETLFRQRIEVLVQDNNIDEVRPGVYKLAPPAMGKSSMGHKSVMENKLPTLAVMLDGTIRELISDYMAGRKTADEFVAAMKQNGYPDFSIMDIPGTVNEMSRLGDTSIMEARMVNAETAKEGKCTCTAGKEICWHKGFQGTLSKDQKDKFCAGDNWQAIKQEATK